MDKDYVENILLGDYNSEIGFYVITALERVQLAVTVVRGKIQERFKDYETSQRLK